MIGKQIAWAYQADIQQFKAILQQAQGLGMSAEQAAQLKANVAKSGKIGASLGAAKEYIAQKEHERAEQRAARKEKQIEAEMQALSAPPQAWKVAAQAYLAQKAWASFRAQERASASLPPKNSLNPGGSGRGRGSKLRSLPN